LNIIDSLRKDL